MKNLIAVMFLAIVPALGRSDSFQGLVYSTSGTVTAGEWTTQFSAAKAKAKSADIPLVAVYFRSTCGYCKRLASALAESSAVSWAKKRGYLFVVGIELEEGETDGASSVASFAQTGTQLPFVGVWWPKGNDGKEVKVKFNGRSGLMPVTSGTLAKQFMDSVDKYVGGYSGLPSGCEVTVSAANTARGTVSGSGSVKQNSKVKVKAVAKSGYYFAGWYLDSSCKNSAAAKLVSGGNLSAADYLIVESETSLKLYAKFVTKAEDLSGLAIKCDDTWRINTAAETDEFDLQPASVTTAKVSVKNLPSGVKLSNDKLVVASTQKLTPGEKTATITLKGSSGASIVRTLVITIPNLDCGVIHGLNVTDAGYTLYQGVEIGEVFKGVYADAGWNLSAGSLPSGVKWNTKTLEFTTNSVPTKAGVFRIKVAAKNGSTTKKSTATVTVVALPDWAKGTFNGGGELGQATLTVSSVGKISGKFLSDGKTWTVSAASFKKYNPTKGIYTATLTMKCGKEVDSTELTLDESGASCEFFTVYRNLWKTEPYKTDAKTYDKAPSIVYETADAEERAGTITLVFNSSGAVKVKGSFVYGVNSRGANLTYSVNGSSVLADPQDDKFKLFLYLPPKSGKFAGYVDCLNLLWTGSAFETAD